MSRAEVTAFYEQRIAELESGVRDARRLLGFCYAGRLFSFVAIVAALLFFFGSGYHSHWILVSLAALTLFLSIVRYDLRLDRRLRKLQFLLELNRGELQVLDHKFLHRPDGAAYRELDPHLADDFDLFGPGSLFQYLNRCVSLPGMERLAGDLCRPPDDPQQIRSRQEAIRELSEHISFMQDFQAEGMFMKEGGQEIRDLKAWLNEPPGNVRLLQILCLLIPAVNLVLIGLFILNLLPWNLIFLPVFLGLGTVYAFHKRLQQAHAHLGRTAKTFGNYAALFRLMEEQTFQSPFLLALREKLTRSGITASASLAGLNSLLNRFDLRFNVLLSFLFNALVVFDLQVYIRLIAWKHRHNAEVERWFEALAAQDALNGPAVYAFNHPEECVYPELSAESFEIRAVGMGHPLIEPGKRVCNTWEVSGTPSVTIITGANMAGKSTFLRTICINLIMAMNGFPVCARSFVFSPCTVLSSIKIQDSLTNNESYFYAELLRLEDIIQQLSRKRVLVILDEILRGTNTRDKQAGTLGLLRKLIRLDASVILATHDLVIGELESTHPGIVRNFCFEVELEKDQLVFDYTLKKGISQKLNASFLMKQMGILD